MATIGIGQPRFPAVQRIMIAVAHERPDAGGVQAAEAVDECTLGPQAAVRAVVNVAGHQQGISPLGDAEVDDVLV